MAITKKIRFEIFKRDKFTCQYCGRSAPDVVLHVDHLEPRSKGGGDDYLNLITSCSDCNMGKKARRLSDDSVVQKQSKQLKELQLRREQMEMMVEWQKSLIDLDERAVTELHGFWRDLVEGYSLSDHGLRDLRKWVRQFGIEEVIEAIKTSTEQYLIFDSELGKHTQESVEKAFEFIPRIIRNRKRLAEKPYLKDLYYIRGIVRNKYYCNDWVCLELLERAYMKGVDIETLKKIAISAGNWTNWSREMNSIIQGGE